MDLLTYGDLDELKKHRLLGNKDISYSAGASGSGVTIFHSPTCDTFNVLLYPTELELNIFL